jgi:hypothetical protein
MLALEEITTEQVDDVTSVNTSNNVNTQELDEDAVQKLDQVGNSEFNVESDTNNNNTKNESFVLLPSAAAVVGQDREMRKAKKCSKCSLALSNGCSNRCCKKCCLELDEPCELHRQKTSRTNCKLKNVSEDISSSTTKRGRKPKQKGS